MDGSIYFNKITKGAKDLIKAEQSGKPMPASFDFANSQICAWCKQSIEPPKKPLRCSACKAPIYCSAKVYVFDSFVITSLIPFVFVQCVKRDWKTPAVPNAVTHKVLCTDNKVY